MTAAARGVADIGALLLYGVPQYNEKSGGSMARYVGAIDQGTTSTRFIVFDRGGNIIPSAQKEHKQIFPKPGWVEHDPIEIWRNTQEVAGAALARAGLGASDLAAVGMSNQRETTLLWDKHSGKPLHNALGWQAS